MDSPRLVGSLTLAQAASIAAAIIAAVLWLAQGRAGAAADEPERGGDEPASVEPRD